MEQLKKELYDAFYWYYRKEYGRMVDLVEKENLKKIDKTRYAEIYVRGKIEELIKKLRG